MASGAAVGSVGFWTKEWRDERVYEIGWMVVPEFQGRRIATALAESGVNSLVARRMVKKQQMQWSKRGAHLLLQVRAAVLNGDLRERLMYEPPKHAHRSRIAWLFEPTPPLLKTA